MSNTSVTGKWSGYTHAPEHLVVSSVNGSAEALTKTHKRLRDRNNGQMFGWSVLCQRTSAGRSVYVKAIKKNKQLDFCATDRNPRIMLLSSPFADGLCRCKKILFLCFLLSLRVNPPPPKKKNKIKMSGDIMIVNFVFSLIDWDGGWVSMSGDYCCQKVCRRSLARDKDSLWETFWIRTQPQ